MVLGWKSFMQKYIKSMVQAYNSDFNIENVLYGIEH